MKYINEIIKLSQKAAKKNNVPVGAIITDENGNVIGRGYNKKEQTKNPMDHAEIIAINKACKYKRNWNLNGCLLYVTMEPCAMCKSVINETRIREVRYLIKNEKEKYKNVKGIDSIKFDKIDTEYFENVYLSILRDFFLKKRKKSRKIDNNVI